ncbi:MAG: peptidoglycan-binding domain-containing protein [Coleofasciculaceae cyanobacterium]
MWNRYSIAITAIGLGLTASLVSYDVVQAARVRNYTPREMRAVLNGFGYNVPVSDGPLTDTATLNAVREFQRGYKLAVDGIPGPNTQDLMAELMMILHANLNLVVKPSPPLARSQYYDSATEAVVKQYQEKVGLPVTGIASLPVRKQLDDEATLLLNNQSTPTPTPAPRPRVTPSPSPSPSPSPVPGNTTTPAPRPTLTPLPRTTPTPLPRTTPTPLPQTIPTPLPRTTPIPLPSPIQTTPRALPTPTTPTPLPSPGGVPTPMPLITPSP